MAMMGGGIRRNHRTSQNHNCNDSQTEQYAQLHAENSFGPTAVERSVVKTQPIAAASHPHHISFQQSADDPSLIPLRAHSISTSTSSPSIRSGKTSTRSCTGYSAIPVFVWNVHECHGQTTRLPSSQPCPNGPCRCGHQLSSAESSPSTFARHTPTPSTSASATCPTAGASANPHNLTHFATKNLLTSMLIPTRSNRPRFAPSSRANAKVRYRTSQCPAPHPSQTSARTQPRKTSDPLWLIKAIAFTILVALFCGYLTLCLLFYQGQWQLVLHPTRTSAASCLHRRRPL